MINFVSKIICSILVLFIFSASLTCGAENISNIEVNQDKQIQQKIKPLFKRFIFREKQSEKKLLSELSKLKKEKNYKLFFPMIITAFLWGLLHAVGSCHGKVIASSFLMCRARKRSDGLYFGVITGLIHGGISICIVFILNVILRLKIDKSFEIILYNINLISYSLIFFAGVILVFKNFYTVYRGTGPNRHIYSGKFDNHPPGTFTMAVVTGMAPSPVTIATMVFSVSTGLILPGIILALAETLGIVIVITFAGYISAVVKLSVLNILDYAKREFADRIELFIEFISSAVVTAVSSWLVYSLLNFSR